MAKTNFYLKDPKAKSDTLIYLFYNYNGKRFKYSVGESINPKFWNEEDQRAKKSYTGSLELNDLIDSVEEAIQKINRVARTQQKTITNEYLKEQLDKEVNPTANHKKDFFEYYAEFMEVQKPSKSYRTIQKYQTLLNHLTAFQKKKSYLISFDKIDMRFYELLTTYYINDLKLLNNSTAKYIKTLKTFLHWATEREYNTNVSFVKFKATEKDADIIYLTEKELFALYNYDLSNNPRLEKVRDTFCFGCFTGLRYSDILKVKKHSVKQGEINLISDKTTAHLIVPLNDYSKAILEKYDYSLPVLSNQKTNDALKELSKQVEINEPVLLTKFRGAQEIQITKPKHELVSTHTARRTFVTLSLEKGMRAETVMSITGHKEYSTFKKYIKITSKVKLVEMNKIWNNNVSLLKAV